MRSLDQSPDPIYELIALKLNAESMLHLGGSHFRPAVERYLSSFFGNLGRIERRAGMTDTEIEKLISFPSSGSIIACGANSCHTFAENGKSSPVVF
jgi:hypothetical protein